MKEKLRQRAFGKRVNHRKIIKVEKQLRRSLCPEEKKSLFPVAGEVKKIGAHSHLTSISAHRQEKLHHEGTGLARIKRKWGATVLKGKDELKVVLANNNTGTPSRRATIQEGGELTEH